MIQSIIAFSLRRKWVIGLGTVILIGLGLFEFTRLPIDAVPDITNNQVQVITVAPSLGAPDMERLVTFPIEQATKNIPGLIEMRSFSRFGLSLITLVFDEDSDIYWIRQQVSERLVTVQSAIPTGIEPPQLAPLTTGLGEIFQYILKPSPGYEELYSTMELRTIQDWVVRRQLLGVEGVADVSSFGGQVKQYEISIQPAKLQASGVTLAELFEAIHTNNENTGGAYIEQTSTALFIRTEGLVEKIQDIQQIVIKVLSNGTPILVQDVAEVRLGHAIRYGALTHNADGEVAGGIVMMLKGENSNQVIERVKERVAEIQQRLPRGVELIPYLDRSKMVNSTIKTVETNLIEGALIVIFVLVLFLGNLRAGLLVASVIPLSLFFAIILMNQLGISGNLMSMGALDFGLIVDGAVIIVEAVLHVMAGQNKSIPTAQEMDRIVQGSASRMMNSAVFGQIIILVVYLPLFTLEGMEGKMFRPMVETVSLALLGAFLLSITYVPVVSSWSLKRSGLTSWAASDRWFHRLAVGHRNWLSRLIVYPKWIAGASLCLFIASIGIFSRLGGEFIPALPEGDFAVETRLIPGSSLEASTRAIQQAANLLLPTFPEIEQIVGKTGSGEIPTDPMPMEASDMMIILKPKDSWTSASSWEELAEKMETRLQQIPGVQFSFQYPVAMRFNELMTGAKQEVVCKIYGENLDSLALVADQVGRLVGQVQGTRDVYVEPIQGVPQAVIQYDRNKLAAYGVSIADLNTLVQTNFAGKIAGLVFENERRFDLVVRMEESARLKPSSIQNLLIPLPSGGQIPLGQLATITLKESINQIQREDAKRRILVGFNTQDRDVQSIVEELKDKLSQSNVLPSGYYITYGGSFEHLEAASKRLAVAVPISLALIFGFLFFALRSWSQSALVYATIPLSAVGGILFLAWRGLPFSISAGVGFIALFGVAVLNGIVLISEFNRLRTILDNPLEVVLQGTQNRLRPVLMTATVASLGFLPMALSHGSGAEVQRPLATVVIGGLVVATFLTLFVLPSLYYEIILRQRLRWPFKKGFLVWLLVTGSMSTQAQTTLSWDRVMDSLDRHNPTLLRGQLEVEKQKIWQRGGLDLAGPTVGFQVGQINSALRDNALMFQQSMPFPTVLQQQKKVLAAQVEETRANVIVEGQVIRQQIAEAYYTWVLLEARERRWKRIEDLYTQFVEKATLRFDQGETDLLEISTAQLQLGQVRWKIRELNRERNYWHQWLQVLLPLPETWQPDTTHLFFSPQWPNQPTISPRVELAKSIQTAAEAQWQLEKNRRLPQVNWGLNSVTFQGTGADNRTYTGGQRFHSAQIGLTIPLFPTVQSARIEASRLEVERAKLGVRQESTQFEVLSQALASQVKALGESLRQWETEAIPQAQKVETLAREKLEKGSIDYLEWLLLTQQIHFVWEGYLDTIHQQNTLTIQRHFLTHQEK